MCSTKGNQDPLFPIVSGHVAIQFSEICRAEFLELSGECWGEGDLDEGDVGRVLAACGAVELWVEILAVRYGGVPGHVVDKVEFCGANVSGCFQVVAMIEGNLVNSVAFNGTKKGNKNG